MRESAGWLRLTATLLCVLCAGCASAGEGMWDSGSSQRQATRLQERLLENPGDTEALRDLGILYLRARQYGQGYEYLQRAYEHDSNDPSTLFHLGLAAELVGQRDTALRVYGKYADVPERSAYRKRLQGRYLWLQRLALRDDIQLKLQEEAARQGGDVSPRIVAVFPFRFLGNDERYEALGRGLAEMLMADLANVDTLRVVERVRLQALLDELELARSGFVDEATAPRAGRLLGAGRIVGGNYDVPDRRSLVLDTGIMELPGSPAFAFGTDVQTGALSELFRLEKELVFRLIDEMDIVLTAEERERIEFIPTQNLQAFLAYSRGLEQEDVGNFRGAARSYRQASRLDPSFGAAQTKAEGMEGLSSTSGTAEEVLAEVILTSGPVDLVESRIGSLNTTLGATVIPGQDTRKPVQETPDLPLPPPPPSGN